MLARGVPLPTPFLATAVDHSFSLVWLQFVDAQCFQKFGRSTTKMDDVPPKPTLNRKP